MNWKALIFQTIAKHHTIGETESTHFQEAAEEYGNVLQKDPTRISAAALAAFNLKLPENAQELDTPESLIISRWDTFRNKYPDRPVLLIRCVMVLGLLELAKDADQACIIYLSLVDVFNRMQVSHESRLRDAFLVHLKMVFEETALRAWSHVTGNLSSKQTPKLDLQFNKDLSVKLKEQMRNALLNDHAIGQAIYNGSWRDINRSDSWGDQFAERSSTAIVTTLKAILETLNIELPKFYVVANVAADAQLEVFRSVKRQERQSKVLWWLQVRYSPSAKTSYRTMTPLAGAAQMAVDFLDLTPSPVPEHVEAVLVEAMMSTYGEKAEQEVPFLTVLKELVLPGGKDESLPVLGTLIHPKVSRRAFESLTGLNPVVSVTPVQLAVWLFRLLQVRRLL